MNVNNLKPTLFTSVGLLICFFIPWISIGSVSPTAWTIAIRLDGGSSLVDTAFHTNYNWLCKLLYLIYFLPVLILFNIKSRLERKRPAVNEYFIGLFFCGIIFFYIKMLDKQEYMSFMEYGVSWTEVLSAGFYVFLVLCIVGLYMTVVMEVDDYMSFAEEMESEIEASVHYTPVAETQSAQVAATGNRSEIYERLSQLHGLYEKGILDQEHYDTERKALLALLPNNTPAPAAPASPQKNKTAAAAIAEPAAMPDPVTHEPPPPSIFPEEQSPPLKKALKALLILLILGIAGYGAFLFFTKKTPLIYPSDIVRSSLRGNIKSYVTYRYKASSDGFDIIKGEPATIDGIGPVTEITFDDKGFMTRSGDTYINPVPAPDGMHLTYYFYNDAAHTKLQKTMYSSCSPNGKPLLDSLVKSNGTTVATTSYKWSDDLRKADIRIDAEGNNYKFSAKYNEGGVLVKQSMPEVDREYINNDHQDPTHVKLRYKRYYYEQPGPGTIDYKYKYDDHNNWVKRTTYHDGAPVYIEERTFIYDNK